MRRVFSQSILFYLLALSLSSAFAGPATKREQKDFQLQESGLEMPALLGSLLSNAFGEDDNPVLAAARGSSGTNIRFSKANNNTLLNVHLALPQSNSANRNLSVAVVGKSHLRVKIATKAGTMQMFATHTYPLPVPVSEKNIVFNTTEDGNALVQLQILNGTTQAETDSTEATERQESDNPFLTMEDLLQSITQRAVSHPLFRLPFLSDLGPDGDDDDDGDNDKASIRNSNAARRTGRANSFNPGDCREESMGDDMRYRKCVCDSNPSSQRRAVCYAKMISTAVNMARKMRFDDFATSIKHSAFDCADTPAEQTNCLQQVADKVVDFLARNQSEDDDTNSLKDQIRDAIDSEDTLTDYTPSIWRAVAHMIFGGILLTVLFWAGMVYALRRGWFGNRTGGILSHLSSVLTQHTSERTSQSSPTQSQSTVVNVLKPTRSPSTMPVKDKSGDKQS